MERLCLQLYGGIFYFYFDVDRMLLPEEEGFDAIQIRRNAWEKAAEEIILPAFEHTDVFLRSVGQETDIVSKEMF